MFVGDGTISWVLSRLLKKEYCLACVDTDTVMVWSVVAGGDLYTSKVQRPRRVV